MGYGDFWHGHFETMEEALTSFLQGLSPTVRVREFIVGGEVKRVPKKVLKKAVPKKVLKKAAPKKVATKKAAPKKVAPKKVAPKKVAPKKVAKAAAPKKAAPPAPARLNRERKRLAEVEAAGFTGVGTDDRMLSSARAGHDELRSELRQHTEGGPELTAGDVDAKWQDAYAVGDEAPGGDNPTPDQDRVDDIGKALGVVYEDDEELMGGEEITERDEHRWELDPASKDDDAGKAVAEDALQA